MVCSNVKHYFEMCYFSYDKQNHKYAYDKGIVLNYMKSDTFFVLTEQ